MFSILLQNRTCVKSRAAWLHSDAGVIGQNFIMPSLETDPFAIRPALVGDAPALIDLRMQALQRHPEAFSSDQAREQVRGLSFWEQRIADVDHSVIYVAADGPELAAMTGIYREEQTKLRHVANVWGVYVRPEYRGRGAASQLIQACIAWASERDLKIIKLAVVTTNSTAIRCYMRAGFRVYGVEPRALQHDGEFYDELLMALEL